MNDIPKLPEDRFKYENYAPELLSELPNLHKVGLVNTLMRIQKYAVGFTDGSELSYRPHSESKAVMFSYQGMEFWLHIDSRWFDNREQILKLSESVSAINV